MDGTYGLAVRRSRRQFLQRVAGVGLSAAGLGALAGCSALGKQVGPAQGPAPLETRTVRLAKNAAICFAPEYLADSFLRDEGFSDVQYVEKAPSDVVPALSASDVDLGLATVGLPIVQTDADDSVVIVAGMHVGCFELFANATIRSMSDLKGKRVAVTSRGSGRHVHLSAMAAYVGVDPNRDIDWVFDGPADAIREFTDGEVDAFMAFPPEPQELRAKNVGRVIVRTATDRPWSQYFCCMLVANRAYAQKNPVATKRALRAMLKAADLCVSDSEQSAHYLVDQGYTTDYGLALQSLQDVPYDKWRDYDPEDTVRFYSLRLQEIGMIKSSPEKIIQRGTDWRFLNELKQELKA